MIDRQWTQIGYVAVDSGQLLLCDPRYIGSEWEHDIDFNMEKPSMMLSYNGCCHASLSKKGYGELRFPLELPGAGICFHSGIGDGLYPIYAKFDGVRIAEIKVVMLPHPVLGAQEEAFAHLQKGE